MLTGVDDDVYQDETDELHGNVAIGDQILNRAHQITLEEMIESITLADRNVLSRLIDNPVRLYPGSN